MARNIIEAQHNGCPPSRILTGDPLVCSTCGQILQIKPEIFGEHVYKEVQRLTTLTKKPSRRTFSRN